MFKNDNGAKQVHNLLQKLYERKVGLFRFDFGHLKQFDDSSRYGIWPPIHKLHLL